MKRKKQLKGPVEKEDMCNLRFKKNKMACSYVNHIAFK